MDAKARPIEVTAAIADLLEARAAALGMSVSDLLAGIAGTPRTPPPDVAPIRAAAGGVGPPPQVALEATPAAAEAERARMRWGEVKAWIDSWGKPDELPRPKLGKL
jgi:hypothetical protein